MTAIQFLPPAEAELLEAVTYYEARASGLGADFLAEVRHSSARIADHPGLGVLGPSGVRQLATRRFPFRLVYVVEPEFVLIVAVAHQRRRPGYWIERVARH